MNNEDHSDYLKFHSKSRLDKAINSLLGIVEGISIDGKITQGELGFLQLWLSEYRWLRELHPYSELIPVVEKACGDGVLSQDEREDFRFVCDNLRSERYYNMVTGDMQRLHGLLAGIIADGVVTEDELRGLSRWIGDHDHLKTLWPYDELESVVSAVLKDGVIDKDEQTMLREFFSEFVALFDDQTITAPPMLEGSTLVGVCAMCPEIAFDGKTFCFTGASSKLTRNGFQELVERLGGNHAKAPTKGTHYLVVGAAGNPAWAYSCYGRKVETAVKLRKQGVKLVIVHEHDFHDAVADVT
jgi:hypothetical protein